VGESSYSDFFLPMIHFLTPFRTDKNLGKAYNDAVSLIPDSDHVCITDYDVCFLSPRSIPIIYEYVEKYPNDVLTCWASRGHVLSAQTLNHEGASLQELANAARVLEKRYDEGSVREITKHLSGFCLVFPKSLWKEVPFKEGIGCLGVDTQFLKDLKSKGKKVYLMQRVFALHAYRLDDIRNKSHLL
jgi:hypothetical protein